jgi:hypothetical protein
MTRPLKLVVIILLLLGVAAPVAPAAAQGFVSPFIGTTFNAPSIGSATSGSEAGYGFQFGGLGKVIGGETDLAYFPKVLDNDAIGLEKSKVFTFSGNILVNIPTPVVRPYVTGGAGYMRLNVQNLGDALFPSTDVTSSSFSWNAGGGLFVFFSGHFGIRGDVRYFKGMNIDTDALESGTGLRFDQFDFWRGTIGFAAKF